MQGSLEEVLVFVPLVPHRQVEAGIGSHAQHIPLRGERARRDVRGGAARKPPRDARPDPEVPADRLPVVPLEVPLLLEVGDPDLGEPRPGEKEAPPVERAPPVRGGDGPLAGNASEEGEAEPPRGPRTRRDLRETAFPPVCSRPPRGTRTGG